MLENRYLQDNLHSFHQTRRSEILHASLALKGEIQCLARKNIELYHYGVRSRFYTIMNSDTEVEDQLDPSEIRRIRVKLGLSQLEAGKLLGGGPRAFTKYEKGIVKPASSVVNLLRLLEANPSMISVLRESESQPILTSETPSPFEITAQHVAALTDRTLPKLLRRLLWAECISHELPDCTIHVADNITAPDGGEDGRICWSEGPDQTMFLPCRLSQFQLKAADVKPSQAANQVVNRSGEAKIMVQSVLEQDGCYLMLCAHNYTRMAIEKREVHIRKVLRDANLSVRDDQVQFRDAGQIADWVNRHPSVAIWLKELTQPGTVRPLLPWSYLAGHPIHQTVRSIEDGRLRELKTWLYNRLIKPRGIARVLGQSEAGKSRLVLEALDPDDDEKPGNLSSILMFADQSEADGIDISNAVRTLVSASVRAVVVVDKCPIDSHRTLVDIVSRSNSRLSLLTIDNEFERRRLREEEFKLEKASNSVLEAIIDNLSPGLPPDDKRRLVHFSDGCPGIAIRIMGAWTNSRPLTEAMDTDLAESFVLGRIRENRELLLEVALLTATVGRVVLDTTIKDDLEEVSHLGCSLSPRDFHAGIRRLIDRGVVQARGRIASFPASPISMMLSERWWQEQTATEWDRLLAGEDTSTDLKTRLARRLALLNVEGVAGKVANHVCRSGGLFDGAAGLFERGHAEVLSSLAEIDAQCVAEQIDRSFGTLDDLALVEGETRRHLVWALEKICFPADTFDLGAHLLMRLAAAEVEDGISNNATGCFESLFTVVAGATEADGDSRLAFLDEVAASNDPAKRSVVVKALTSGIKTRFISRPWGAEIHGLRPTLEEWTPSTNEEAIKYLEACLSRLAGFAKDHDRAGLEARKALGRQLRELIDVGAIEAVEKVVEELSATNDTWNEALESVGHALQYDVSDTDSELVERITRLKLQLQPQDLESRVRFLVTDMPFDFPNGEKLDLSEREKKKRIAIEEVAVEAARDLQNLEGLLPELCQGYQRMALAFGESLAQELDFPREWFEKVARAVLKAPEKKRNFDLLVGFAKGLSEAHSGFVEDFKNRAASESSLAPALPQVCRHVGISNSDIVLVESALNGGVLPAQELRTWIFGGAFSVVSFRLVARLLDTMLDHSAEAYLIAVELLEGYVDDSPNLFDSLRPQIIRVARYTARWEISGHGSMTNYYFEALMKRLLTKGRQDADACAVAKALAGTIAKDIAEGNDDLIVPLLPDLLADFPEVSWTLIGQAIVGDKEQAWHFHYLLRGSLSPQRDVSRPILSLPEETLFAWCDAHPNRAPAFVASILPVLNSYTGEESQASLHPTIARLLDEFGDNHDVLHAVASNLHTFVWSGSAQKYFARLKAPLRELLDHSRGSVRRWAKKMLHHLDELIDNERSREEEREAQGDY